MAMATNRQSRREGRPSSEAEVGATTDASPGSAVVDVEAQGR